MAGQVLGPPVVLPDDLASLASRTRLALELVHDPAAELYKNTSPHRLGAPAQAELRRRCQALLQHCWALLERAYGIKFGYDFYSVHRHGDPLNCLALTTDVQEAAVLAEWWPGGATIAHVSGVDAQPEAWVALGLALHWCRPEWLRDV